MASSSSVQTPARAAIFWWVTLGFVAIMLQAVFRLGARAVETVGAGLSPLEWGLLFLWTLFMLYTEAWRGFHLRFSPRFAARAHWLALNPTPARVVLGPFFGMSLFHATRRRVIASWMLVGMIVTLVVAVRQLHEPWRGIVDAGVVLGLLAGTASTLWFTGRVFVDPSVAVDPELPEASVATAAEAGQ